MPSLPDLELYRLADIAVCKARVFREKSDARQVAALAIWRASLGGMQDPRLLVTVGWRRVQDWERKRTGTRHGKLINPTARPARFTGDRLVWDGDTEVLLLLGDIPVRERFVVEARLRGYSVNEVGRMLGVTEGRVSQIEKAGLEKLRKAFLAQQAPK